MSDNEFRQMAEQIRLLLEAQNKPKPNGPVNMMADKLKLNIGSVIAVVGSIALATWVVAGKLNKIEAGVNWSWQLSEQREWSEQLKEKNPSLYVPNPDKIRRDTNPSR